MVHCHLPSIVHGRQVHAFRVGAITRRANHHILHVGWSDASTGPLLLRIQDHYSVSYTVVSVIFICNFSGFLLAALTNVWFSDRFGMGKTTLLGAVVHVSFHESR